MPIRIELLTAITIWLILGIISSTIVFVFITVQRRVNRRRYFEELDRARLRVQEEVDPIFLKEPDLAGAAAIVRSFRSKAERQALEEAFFQHTNTPEERDLTRQILMQMGRMQEWIDIVRSRAKPPDGAAARLLAEIGDCYVLPGLWQRLRLRFRAGYMTRCIVATKMARVPTSDTVCAFVAGLADPHPDVRELCVRNLGNLGDLASLPVLLEELVKVLDGTSPVSTRVIKTALVQFPLEACDGFLPALEGSNRRARFFAVDVLREIADRTASEHGLLNKNDFSPALYRLFVEKLHKDDWADVRARSAMVIAHFHDPTSNSLMDDLSRDKEWFVRLQTCRSVAGKFFLPLAPALAQRLTDDHWLVREAAVRALMEMGETGVLQIIQAFMNSSDRYTTEQIAEELQRSGVLIALMDELDDPERYEQVVPVVRRMISIGKIGMVLAYLLSPVPSRRKLLLLEELSVCYLPDCTEALRTCVQKDSDEQVREAAALVLEAQAQAQAQALALAESAAAELSTGGN